MHVMYDLYGSYSVSKFLFSKVNDQSFFAQIDLEMDSESFWFIIFFEKFEVRNWEMKLSSCEIPAADQSADKISISFGEYPLY